MRFAEERYVKVYTRDTTEWIALTWEARALFYELLRKVDRAGILLTGRTGLRGLAALLRLPHEVVERAMPELLEDTCVVAVEGGFLVRNFIDAQETPQADKVRKAEERARARDKAASTSGVAVTSSHAPPPNLSRAVTPSHSDLIRSETRQTDPIQEITLSRDPAGIAPPGEDPDAYPGSPHVTQQLELVPPKPKAPRRTKPKPAPSPDAPPPSGYRELVDHYFATFERVRGVRPAAFGSREGGAVKKLLGMMSLEQAKGRVDGAFSGFGSDRVTITDIANNPDRYTPKPQAPPVAEPGRPIGVFAANPGKSLEQLRAEGLYPPTPPPPTRTPEEHAAAMRAEADRKFNNPSPVGPDARPFPQDFLDPEDQIWPEDLRR